MIVTIVLSLTLTLMISVHIYGYYADKRELERFSQELDQHADTTVTQIVDHSGGGSIKNGTRSYFFRSNHSLLAAIECAERRDCNVTKHHIIIGGA